MEEGQLWRQIIVAAIASLGVLSTGFCLGWTSPINVKLLDPATSPLGEVPTSEQISWIGSLLTIGAIFGPFVGGFLAPRVGRKWSLLSTALPMFVGSILMALATNVYMIYVGRLFWGLSMGMMFTLSPMYCAEIATDDRRGALGSFVQLFIVFGLMLVYTVGAFCSYHVVQYVGIGALAVFSVSFYFMPETPIYYLSKNDRVSAGKSLMFLRGKTLPGVQRELDKMAEDVETSMKRTAKLTDIFRGSNFKAFYISSALMIFQQMCGVNVVLFYMTAIFKASGTDLEPSIATMIIGVVQILSSFVTPFVVDRLGRRILFMTSSCGTALGQFLLGVFFTLEANKNPVVQSIGFLPIMSLILFITTYSLGLGPLPWAIMSELMPVEVKATASPIATAINWTTSFFVTRYFHSIAEAIGMGAAFFIFGGCCVVSFIFTLFLLPETKGKSLQEIQDLLAGKSPDKTIQEESEELFLQKLPQADATR